MPTKRLPLKKQERASDSRRAAAAREEKVSPAEIGASPEGTAAFDPRPFLAKLAAGKTSREYQGGEIVFSQGGTADSVFYIQSGKAKLTVVSDEKPGPF